MLTGSTPTPGESREGDDENTTVATPPPNPPVLLLSGPDLALAGANEPAQRLLDDGRLAALLDRVRAACGDDGAPAFDWPETGPGAQGDAVHSVTTHRLQGRPGRAFVVVLNDGTARRAGGAATAAARRRADFLSQMSHEFRTPLNAVIGLTHILSQETLSPAHQDLVRKVATAARHLLALVDDVLDLSKIDAGRMALENRPFAVRHVLEQVGDMLSERCRAKGIALLLDVAPDVPTEIVADPSAVRQVLLNLGSNAEGATERGAIRLSCARRAGPGGRSELRFEVEDTGRGIAPDLLPHVFDPYRRGPTAGDAPARGTGLGLPISRRMVRLMGGDLGVESRDGVGSRFWFTLPLEGPTTALPASDTRGGSSADADDDAGKRAREVVAALGNPRVLVAEDHPVNRDVLGHLMNCVAIEPCMVDGGQAAIDRVADEPWDLVLMDVQMPDVDGLEATLRIRGLPHGARVPIVALTADAFASSRAACLEAGMDDFLAKPLAPAHLFGALERWLPEGRARRSAGAPATRGVAASRPAAPGGDPAPAVMAALRGIPGVDVDTGVASVGGLPSTYVQLLSSFTVMYGAGGTRSAEGLHRADDAGLRAWMHAFRSPSTLLGLQSLAAAAESLEQCDTGAPAATHAMAGDLASFLAELDGTVRQIRLALAGPTEAP